VFEAQQAAERALKALCLHVGIGIPKTHSLVYLMDLLERQGITIPADVREADTLTQYAVAGRYPGWLSVSEEEYHQALALAERVVTWVEDMLGGEP
jgi:HEPN domain-containing protein